MRKRSPCLRARDCIAARRAPDVSECGIAVRVISSNDYYLVRANALEDNVRFYRIVKGRRAQLATADVKVASGEWHSLA